MSSRYKDVVWRLPTMEEADAFIEATKDNRDCNLKGSGWTSTPYQGSKVTCLAADFKPYGSFDRFHGTHNSSHGYYYACLRLVGEVCDIDPSREQRLESDGACWVDHRTGLAWQKQFISDEGLPTDNPNEIWCGHWLDAFEVIERFNANLTSQSIPDALETPFDRDVTRIRDEWGEPDMVLLPEESVTEDRKLLEAIAEEYWVFLTDKADGGCIVYGRFKRGWVANPALRWPMAEMTRRLLSTKDGGSWQTWAGCWQQ